MTNVIVSPSVDQQAIAASLTSQLIALAKGESVEIQAANDARKALKVARMTATESVLSVVRRFHSFEAFKTADKAAQSAAKDAYAARGGKSVKVRAYVDGTYLNIVSKVSVIVSRLPNGWERLAAGEALGTLHSLATKGDKVGKEEAKPERSQAVNEPEADVMPVTVPYKTAVLPDDLQELMDAINACPDRDKALAAAIAAVAKVASKAKKAS